MANVTTTNAVDTFMQSTDAAGMRTNLGLGDSATKAVGTTSGTVAAGDDSRIVGAVQTSRTVSAGTGLAGGGNLSADRTLSVDFGKTATTVARGNQTVFQVYGPGNYTIENPFGNSEFALLDIILCSGGGGGGGGSVHLMNGRGGSGGSMGKIKRLFGVHFLPNSGPNFLTVGAGGTGGTGYIWQSSTQFTEATNGGPGGGSIFTRGSGQLILDCSTGLDQTGGPSNSSIPANITDVVDRTINEPYLGGLCDEWGAAGVPIAYNSQAYQVAQPWVASGASGGGSNSTQSTQNGGEGQDLYNLSSAPLAGTSANGFDALQWSDTGTAASDSLAPRIFSTGIGGSGGSSAIVSSSVADGLNLRAGHGAKGSPGSGGGGGGAFYHDGTYTDGTLSGGNGGAGGDGFAILVWHRI
jgi:hypothetical protein